MHSAIGTAIRKSQVFGFGTGGNVLIQIALPRVSDDTTEHGVLARAFSVFSIPPRFRDPVRYLLPLGGDWGLLKSKPASLRISVTRAYSDTWAPFDVPGASVGA